MRSNVAFPGPVTRTHEGTLAPRLTPIKMLRRAVLSTMLFEDTFYESGNSIANTIKELIPQCRPMEVAHLAIDARDGMYLRHAPLFLVRELARVKGNGSIVASTLAHVIQRPDEMGEYLALYWKDNKDAPLSAGSKRGLAAAFRKFNAYSLAKYDRDAGVKLRDVLRITHPKPGLPDTSELWRQVVKRELATPDTWETELSAGKDKKATFERLLRENKLGGLAFLRNLRNMINADVDAGLIKERFTGNFNKVLPFRFISAAKYAPRFEAQIESAMLRACASLPKFKGTTALIVDASGSMFGTKISAKSELDRFDAAVALAILAREQCEDAHVWTFNNKAFEIPARRGFALRDAMIATGRGASCGGLAVAQANARGYDRIIVLTDGQWHHSLVGGGFEQPAEVVSPAPLTDKAYMINIAPYVHGVGGGKWQTINGWSERILDYILLLEQENLLQ
jgi:60 kDa SS-A/Ro ribonucleoprotein